MFEKISIGIKTFLRDEQLFNTIHAVQENLPSAQMIIADCGDMTEEKDGIYADLERAGHKHIQLPFDAGFGQMSNAIVDNLGRPYLLIGSDDFDFSTVEAREGILALQEVLDHSAEVDIASGRVGHRKYEFFLQDFGDKIVEVPVDTPYAIESRVAPWYYDVDLTVNYSLIRRTVFWFSVHIDTFQGYTGPGSMRNNVRWDDDAKIGQGEHGAFFVDCKRAGLKTVYVPGVNINEQQVRNSARYNEFRNRARSPERSCFKKRGIREYVLGDGRVDYKEI